MIEVDDGVIGFVERAFIVVGRQEDTQLISFSMGFRSFGN